MRMFFSLLPNLFLTLILKYLNSYSFLLYFSRNNHYFKRIDTVSDNITKYYFCYQIVFRALILDLLNKLPFNFN